MKRSFVNQKIAENRAFLRSMGFYLPPFAGFSPDQQRGLPAQYEEIHRCRLGWDVTDFGSGDFDRTGLAGFTIRNGRICEAGGKPYAEKILFVQEEQVTPMHFHRMKMEDIINRGGGNLLVRVYNATSDETLSEEPVTVRSDGRRYEVPAGSVVRLTPGESITLPTRQYHAFWGEKGRGKVLVGEVSMVNDDAVDNRFLEEFPRFSRIEEDVPAEVLLAFETGTQP